MRGRLAILALLLAPAALPALPGLAGSPGGSGDTGDSGELLQNGPFTAWAADGASLCPAGWRCSMPPALGAALPTPEARSAPYAAVLAELGWLQQDLPAEPGATYRLSVWYQHPQAGMCMAVVRLLFFDAAGEFLDRPTDHIMEEVPAWTEKVLAATAPPGTAALRVHLAGGCLDQPPGVFVVDDASLRAT